MAFNPGEWESLGVTSNDIYNFLSQQQLPQPSSTGPQQQYNAYQQPAFDPKRFPAPPADTLTPPESEKNSPEPESLEQQKKNMTRSSAASAAAAAEDSKRKVDDLSDSDEEESNQPQHKSQHRDDNSSGVKTKGPQEESRATKRKEQNRAAQRAFRERKERHVKELEDRVAELEDEQKSKDMEAENLRDLLGRLQSENLMLKQSAFTFSFPGGSANGGSQSGSPASTTHHQHLNSVGRSGSSPKLASPSSSSASDSPPVTTTHTQSSLFAPDSNNNRPQLPSSLTALSDGTSSDSSSPRSLADVSQPLSAPTPFSSAMAAFGNGEGMATQGMGSPFPRFQSSPGAFGLGGHTGMTPQPIDFSSINFGDVFNGFDGSAGGMNAALGGANGGLTADGSGFSGNGAEDGKNGITTIATNPLFTSFGGEGMGLDPMAWASFGPADYGLNNVNETGDASATYGTNNGFGSFEELFNSQVGASPQSQQQQQQSQPSYLDFATFADRRSPPSSVSGVSNHGPSAGGSVGGAEMNLVSDDTDLNGLRAGQNGNGNNGNAHGTEAVFHGSCPKTVDDVKRIQARNPSPVTFGPPLPRSPASVASPTGSYRSGSGSGQGQALASAANGGVVPAMFRRTSSSAGSASSPTATATGSALSPGALTAASSNGNGESKESACAHARMAALCADLPRTTKKPGQIEIGRAWEKIRQQKDFTECDIDQLCSELSAKARCDGSRPVLEEASFNDIVQNLSTLHKR